MADVTVTLQETVVATTVQSTALTVEANGIQAVQVTPSANGVQVTPNEMKLQVSPPMLVNGMFNPMTALGDLIVGGSGGAPARLGIGTNGYVLGAVAGTLGYFPIPSAPVSSVFGRVGAVVAAANDYTFAQLAAKPTTLAGYGITDALKTSNNLSDLTSASTSRANLGLGSISLLNTVNNSNWSGTDLSISNGGTGQSTASAALAALGGFTNPMTTAGDIIIGGISGAATRLGIGSNGAPLVLTSGAPTWGTPLGSAAYQASSAFVQPNTTPTLTGLNFGNGDGIVWPGGAYLQTGPGGGTITIGSTYVSAGLFVIANPSGTTLNIDSNGAIAVAVNNTPTQILSLSTTGSNPYHIALNRSDLGSSGYVFWDGTYIVQSNVSFGSTVASSVTDLTKHVNLWGGQYGFNVTGGSLNYIAGAGGAHYWYTGGGTLIGVIGPDGPTFVDTCPVGSGVTDTTTAHSPGLRITNNVGGVGSGGALLFGELTSNFAYIKGYWSNESGNGVGNLVIGIRAVTTDTTMGAAVTIVPAGDVIVGASISAARVFSGYDSGQANSISCSQWFRTTGATGIYFSTYGMGVYATDTTYVRAYASGKFAGADFVISSDERLKAAIRPFEFKGRLRPVNFSFKLDGTPSFGFIAQEVNELYPEAVGVLQDTGMLQLSYPKLTTILSYQVNRVEDIVAEHENRLDNIEKQVALVIKGLKYNKPN